MTTFNELGLSGPLLKAVTDLGYENPTEVQSSSIPVLISGDSDAVILAQTGTGKTAAFGLPLLELLDFSQKSIQALVLAPTRELCVQITNDLKSFSKYINNAHIVAVYGGANIEPQIRDVKKGPQIVVATPGRLMDLMERGLLNFQNVQFVVLDEADEMLSMGFKEAIDQIFGEIPEARNTWLFSATMAQGVRQIAKQFMHSPQEITIGHKNSGNENIEHIYYTVQPRDKYAALKRVADYYPDIFAIVFCRTRAETQEIADALIKDGYNADALHGDLSQAQRDFVMKRYRSKSLQMLVATDVAARGIDVDDVSHVIHFNLADDPESYTHRSGRTARAGKSGTSIVICTPRDVSKLREIEKFAKCSFTKALVPDGFEVCEKQLMALVKKVHHVKVDQKTLERYLPQVYEEFSELSREDIIHRFMSIEFNRFAEYYRNAPDLNGTGPKGESKPPKSGSVRFFINLGKMDGLDDATMGRFIAENSEFPVSDITWCEVKNTFTLCDVTIASSEKLMKALHGAFYQERMVRVESRGNRDAGIAPKRLRGKDGRHRGGDRGDRGDRGARGSFSKGKSFGKSNKSFKRRK